MKTPMDSLILVGTRSNYFGDLMAVTAESNTRAGRVVPFDNLPNKPASNFQSFLSENGLSVESTSFLACPGKPEGRQKIHLEMMEELIFPHPAIAHHSSSIAKSANLGPGTTLNRLVSVGSNTVSGVHCQINRNSSLGHDCVLADFVTIGPGSTLTGHVTVGERAQIGAGAVILPGIQIGRGAIVGAGAVVTKDVLAGTTVVGNPAKPLNR